VRKIAKGCNPLRYFVVCLFLLLASSSFVFGVAPSQSSINGTLDIIYPKQLDYLLGESFDLYFHIINLSGGNQIGNTTALSCSIHIYNSSGAHLVRSVLVYDGDFDWEFKVNSSLFNITGFYPMYIYCNTSAGRYGYFSDGFWVTKTGKEVFNTNSVLFGALLMFLPLMFGWLFMRWAEFLSDEHNVFRLFVTLLSISTIFISLWFAGLGVVRFIDWVSMEDAISITTFIFGVVLFVIVSYFVIYMLYNIFKGIMKKKDDKFEY